MADFKHGLCDCCEEPGICCMAYCCRCITAGQNAEAVGDNCLLYGCCALFPCFMITNGMTRKKIREQYGIQGSLGQDIICHWCCSCCALIQDAREIQAQGSAPSAVSMARE